jgi:hypothetical protein
MLAVSIKMRMSSPSRRRALCAGTGPHRSGADISCLSPTAHAVRFNAHAVHEDQMAPDPASDEEEQRPGDCTDDRRDYGGAPCEGELLNYDLSDGDRRGL